MKTILHQLDLHNTRLFKVLICFGILFCLTTSAGAIGVCTNSNFNTSSLVPAGTSPRQVLVGDLNGDNARDAVVLTGSSNSSSNIVTVLINNGRGSFTNFTSIPLNFTGVSAALADFNLDGNLDLVVSGSSGSGNTPSPVAIFFNNGAGVFSLQNTLNAQNAQTTTAVETGDFNGDGVVDIAVATSNNNNLGFVTLFLNDGIGNFNPAGNFSIGGVPRDLEVADFNNDGISDVLSLNTNSSVSLLLGSNSGTFQIASNFFFTTNSSSFSLFAVGDLNNDNLPDIVLAATDSNSYSVVLNTGGNFGGAFQTTFTDFNLRIRSLAIAQIVGNSSLDIVFGIGGGFSDSVSEAAIVRGNGTGTFDSANPILSATGSTPSSVAVADLNNDGRNDIITSNNTSNDISVLLNNNDKFGPNTFPVTANSNIIAAADFDSDGNLDVITGSTFVTSPGVNNLVISYGNGTGGVSRTESIPGTNGNQFIIATDFNNDSRPDIIIATPNGTSNAATSVRVYFNNGTTPRFMQIPSASANLGFTVKNLVVGDFNNDGIKDIVAGASNSNSIAFIPGTAAGNFGTFASYATPVNSPSVAAGNFNNDNNLDLAVAGTTSTTTSGGAIFTLLGNGNGTFVQINESVSVANPNSITSGDFNGDSITDVAVTSPINNFGSSSTSVVVALGIGSGRFAQTITYPVGLDAKSITAADFNGDSRPDLIVANRASNSFSVLLNLGTGGFGSAGNFLAGVFPEALAVGDFNNDGRNEVATVNRGGNNISLITNSCQEAVTKTDYNGEGKSDFAVFRPSTGTWLVLSNDLNNTREVKFGISTDIPTPGDFDGDGVTDFAVFRPSNGTWYILRSSTNRSLGIQFGTAGDVPVAGDYDGDGRTDIAVFRPSNGTWYIRRGLTSQSQFTGFQFGNNLDRPVPADYDGDGRTDLAVFRDGLWIVLRSSNSSVIYQQFGIATDIPLIGDYDGDGKSDFAVYRGGVWYILQSRTNSLRAESFGEANDRPQPADYDGDGRTDVAVFRPSVNNWYVLRSSDRQIQSVNFGTSNDIPVASLYRY